MTQKIIVQNVGTGEERTFNRDQEHKIITPEWAVAFCHAQETERLLEFYSVTQQDREGIIDRLKLTFPIRYSETAVACGAWSAILSGENAGRAVPISENQPAPLSYITAFKAQKLAREILTAVMADNTLNKIDNFGDLHDHCDANCLAGICEQGHWLHSEPHETDILNEAQTIVNDTLAVLNADVESKALAFEDFQQLRTYVRVDEGSDIAEEIASQDVESGAYVYPIKGVFPFIEKFPREEKFSLMLDRSIYESEDLAELERLLYEFVVEEMGFVKP